MTQRPCDCVTQKKWADLPAFFSECKNYEKKKCKRLDRPSFPCAAHECSYANDHYSFCKNDYFLLAYHCAFWWAPFSSLQSLMYHATEVKDSPAPKSGRFGMKKICKPGTRRAHRKGFQKAPGARLGCLLKAARWHWVLRARARSSVRALAMHFWKSPLEPYSFGKSV